MNKCKYIDSIECDKCGACLEIEYLIKELKKEVDLIEQS